MYTWRTQENPNPRKTTNVQPPNVSIPNEGTPQPTIGTPGSMTTAALVNAIVANPPLAATIGISSLVLNLVDNQVIKDFGRDKDLKTLLKNLQPKAFIGEGNNVPKMLEEWIMSMDDYFALAGYNALAQGIMGREKLEDSTKFWWKLYCQAQGITKKSKGWGELKASLKEHYLPLNYDTIKMNEFLSSVKKGRPIDEYYEEFIKLSRHAPLMTQE